MKKQDIVFFDVQIIIKTCPLLFTMSGIFSSRNKNSFKKQDIVGGVRVWSIIYMINSNGTPPTMSCFFSSKNEK